MASLSRSMLLLSLSTTSLLLRLGLPSMFSLSDSSSPSFAASSTSSVPPYPYFATSAYDATIFRSYISPFELIPAFIVLLFAIFEVFSISKSFSPATVSESPTLSKSPKPKPSIKHDSKTPHNTKAQENTSPSATAAVFYITHLIICASLVSLEAYGLQHNATETCFQRMPTFNPVSGDIVYLWVREYTRCWGWRGAAAGLAVLAWTRVSTFAASVGSSVAGSSNKAEVWFAEESSPVTRSPVSPLAAPSSPAPVTRKRGHSVSASSSPAINTRPDIADLLAGGMGRKPIKVE